MKKILLVAALLPLISFGQVSQEMDHQMIQKINTHLAQNEIDYMKAYQLNIDMYSLNVNVDAAFDRMYFDLVKQHIIEVYGSELKNKGYIRVRLQFKNAKRDFIL